MPDKLVQTGKEIFSQLPIHNCYDSPQEIIRKRIVQNERFARVSVFAPRIREIAGKYGCGQWHLTKTEEKRCVRCEAQKELLALVDELEEKKL